MNQFHVAMLFVVVGFFAEPIRAATSYTLSGSMSQAYYVYQEHKSRGITGGVNLHLSPYFQVGTNIRSQWAEQRGHKEVESSTTVDDDETNFEPFTSATRSLSASVNTQWNILPRSPVVPFLFVGAVRSHINGEEDLNGTITRYDTTTPWGPQGGVGALFRMSRNLFLRLSWTASPGYYVEDPDNPDDVEAKTNGFTTLGINYRP